MSKVKKYILACDDTIHAGPATIKEIEKFVIDSRHDSENEKETLFQYIVDNPSDFILYEIGDELQFSIHTQHKCLTKKK